MIREIEVYQFNDIPSLSLSPYYFPHMFPFGFQQVIIIFVILNFDFVI